MDWLWNLLAAFGSGAFGAMGMGGGGILVIYLTLALAAGQLEAQGINLLFFLPCAVVSMLINSKRGLIDWKQVLWLALGGLPATLLGIWLSGFMQGKWLSWVFAGFLILLGLKEFFAKSEEQPKQQQKQQN